MKMKTERRISFSPPDINQDDVDAVVSALTSGWITTGPRTKQLESELTAYTGAAGCATFSSATAALESALRALGIGEGDEVITSAYTYTASCSCICHVGATPVLCDTASDSYEMDYDSLSELITPRTRAIIPVDIAGRMVDYDALFAACRKAVGEGRWHPAGRNELAQHAEDVTGRPLVIADGAHSLGARYHGLPSGSVADMTAFSFHAVKNLTTAEGGALVWRKGLFDNDVLYDSLMLLSLHGQTKDALAKDKAGAWEYDIAFPGYKCNMTDIQAALGLSQLQRYERMLDRRHEIIGMYENGLSDLPVDLLSHVADGSADDFRSSGHLMLVRLREKDSAFRNSLIEALAERGVATNVHYKPLPLLTAYKDMGFEIKHFPNAFAQFENEVTLPLHTSLSNEDVTYILDMFHEAYSALDRA